MSAEHEAERRTRHAVASALTHADILVPSIRVLGLAQMAKYRGEALMADAPRLLGRATSHHLTASAGDLGVNAADVSRVLGHGWLQTAALARLTGVDPAVQEDVAALGALFNFGVVLFDSTLDRSPEQARLLLDRLTPATIESLLAGRDALGPPAESGAVGVLLVLIETFFRRGRALVAPGAEPVWDELARVIRAMYGAELFSARVRREGSVPTLDVLRQLRRKSALPMWTMTLLGLLTKPSACTPALRANVTRAGEALWIVDDLVDLREDWLGGGWSRPWWLLARRDGGPPRSLAEALGSMQDSGIVAAEAARLARRLSHLRRSLPPAGSALWADVTTTVCSWVGAPEGARSARRRRPWAGTSKT